MKEAVVNNDLDVRHLVVVRGTKAVVNSIKLRVQPGRITTLMGANGAGKTSTVLAISGVVEPAFGEIWLNGQDLKGLEPDEIRRLGVASVPEGHQVLRELTVLENLRAAGGDLSDKELTKAIRERLALFPELESRLNASAGDLSGGQQQMVAIAQALIVSPKFLIIDELSFGLAPSVVARLVAVVKSIAASGTGVLLIEQFTSLALSVADHVYVMSRGYISYDGPPDTLREDPTILHQAYFPVDDMEAVGLA